MAPKGPSLIFPFPCFIDADVQNSEGHDGRQIMRCRLKKTITMFLASFLLLYRNISFFPSELIDVQ
jgi:hypothetical protein